MPNDRAGTWAQESLTLKLLLLIIPTSQKRLQKTTSRLSLRMYLHQGNPQTQALAKSKRIMRSGSSHGRGAETRTVTQTSAASPEPGLLGPCGRLTWSEDSVPCLRVCLQPQKFPDIPVSLEENPRKTTHLAFWLKDVTATTCLSQAWPINSEARRRANTVISQWMHNLHGQQSCLKLIIRKFKNVNTT